MIDRSHHPLPRLPPLVAKFFDNFVDHARLDPSRLHYQDWRRFYEFVRVSRRTKLSAREVVCLLVNEGFSEDQADKVADVYEHLRWFMRPRDAAEAHEYWSVRGPPELKTTQRQKRAP